ncbi:MAG: helicase-related protein, partial [Candidatus Peregrinibacteria bacterium]|nr:helicase-related protein [Candidatus Peregrinibacteria bacterium]
MTNNSTGRLPIEDYKQIIQETVAKNAVTIITAETGAGKSTQVPQYLHEMGHRVVVTQPRRLAARTLAERVSEEMAAKKKASGEIVRDTRHQLGGLVGFRTGYEKLSGKDTQILFCTDGLQLIHELVGDKNTDILILDEVHEWNINIETLVAWTRQQVKNGEKTKLVVMSATMEAEKLAEYYGEDTPVISVPGRLFPVEESVTHSENLIHEVAQLVKEGRNVLVFQPGKKEIEATIEELKDAGVDAEILPLHGQLEPDEQKLCFRHYDRPKVVVATNVAQTSITIDDIDAVVDRGLERRMELDEGIENLALRPTSNADCKQRAGRAGRCKPGKYVLAEDPKDFHGNERRADFPKAEIERSRLDQLVLRLASLRYDATELDFFHQPNRDTLKDAKRALHALGAIDDNEEVTAMGEMMAKLPLSVEYARMLIEAQKNNVVDDVLTAVSILEQDGILARGDEWRKYTKETESDVLAQLDLWRAAQGKKAKEIREMGIHTKSYFQAKELRRKLVTELKKYRVQLGGKSDRTAILKSIVAGMVDHLYEKRGYSDNYYNGSPNGRQLDRRSVLRSGANWIVGKPLDIEIRTRRGPMQLPLVTNASKVNPDWLPEIAPQLVKKERKGRRWSIKNLAVVEDELTVFNGQTIKEEEKIAQATPQTTELFVQYLAQGYGGEYLLMAFHNHNLQVIERAKELWIRSAGKTIPVAGAALKAHYTKLTEGYAIASSSDLETLIASDKLTARDFRLNLEDYATDDEGRQIEEQNPLTITLGDKEFEVEYSAQEPNWQR